VISTVKPKVVGTKSTGKIDETVVVISLEGDILIGFRPGIGELVFVEIQVNRYICYLSQSFEGGKIVTT
jgi:hypothetical protein